MGKSSTRCPNCNKPILLSTVDDLPGGNWRKPKKNEFHSMVGNAPTFDGFSEYEKRVPIGRLVPMDVTTSLFHSAVAGTFYVVSISAVLGAAYVSYAIGGLWHICWIPIVGLGAMAYTYLGGIGLAKKLLEQVESASRDDDKPDPDPSKSETVTLNIKHTNEKGKVIKRTRPTLPDGVTAAMVAEWCSEVYAGIRGLGESEWTGDSGPFTSPQYREFRKLLADQGIMYKNGRAKNSPWALTRSGRNSLPHLAEQLQSTPLSQPTNQPTNNYERFEHIGE